MIEISILKERISLFDFSCYENSEENIRKLLVVNYRDNSKESFYHNGKVLREDLMWTGRYQNDRFIRLKEKK